jgi:hypothetical protein
MLMIVIKNVTKGYIKRIIIIKVLIKIVKYKINNNSNNNE